MKRKKPYLLAGLVLLLFLLCTACGNTEGQIAPQDDPNEGLGGGLSEDTVNDFSGFEGIWLGEANNDYDSMEFDAEGNWTLYLSGEVVDDGYLRYEPEWEAIYAYSSSDAVSYTHLDVYKRQVEHCPAQPQHCFPLPHGAGRGRRGKRRGCDARR